MYLFIVLKKKLIVMGRLYIYIFLEKKKGETEENPNKKNDIQRAGVMYNE
jgi:hypothetical protein